MTVAVFALLLVVVSVLIFCSALASGLETALFSLKPHQLRRLEQNHPALLKFIHLFRENPRRVLNILLLADGFLNVPLVVICLFLLWEGPFPTRIPQWLAAIVIFAIVVLVCDLIPKLLALSAPYRLSALGALTLKISMPLLDREGALQEAEAEMIQEIIKLADKTAKDCMTPRVDTFTMPDDLTNEEAIARLKEKRHRRVPVYVDTPDQVLGIIDVKMFLLDTSEHYTGSLIAPSFVPETMRALELLRLFLTHAQGLAIVVDEFGGTEGIITLSDIVEEILSDAVPRGDVDLYIEPLEKGKFLVSGNARLDDLSEHLGFEIEAEGIDTIGGFVFNRLGYLPPSGTQLEIPRLAITVRRAGRKRIEEIFLEKTTAIPGISEASENGSLEA